MEHKDEILEPTVLSLITTHRCTSSCHSCCFECSPKRRRSMTITEAKEYIDICLEHFSGSIGVLCLTGGEVMLLGIKGVSSILSYSKQKGLINRIVTNGYWATTLQKANQYISTLCQNGLDEINISTGDEHLKFTPIDNVINIVQAAEENTNISGLAVVIEAGENKIYTKESFVSDLKSRELKYSPPKLMVLSSPWVDLENKHIAFGEDEFVSVDSVPLCRNEGCSNLFRNIQISPTGQILACCGFASEYSPFLKLGNLVYKRKTLKDVWTESIDNLLYVWLFLDGPKKIVEYLENGEKKVRPTLHDCEVCVRLLNSKRYLEKICDLSEAKVLDIFLRFNAKLKYIYK